MNEGLGALIWAVVAIVLILAVRRKTGGRRRFSGVGSGAAGAVYDLLNEDKRKAVEIIVEERAGERDPEDKDGNLPALEHPTR